MKQVQRSDFVVSIDVKVKAFIWKLVGAVVFGPPKLLGYDPNIWAVTRLSGNSNDDVTRLRTALYNNLLRRKAANFIMALCLPMALISGYFAFNSYGYFEAIRGLGFLSSYLPQPAASPENDSRLKASQIFDSTFANLKDMGGTCRAVRSFVARNHGTAKLPAVNESALLQVMSERGCDKYPDLKYSNEQ